MEFKEYRLEDLLEEVVDNRGRNPEKYYDFEEHPVIDNYLIQNETYPNLKNVKRYIDNKTFNEFLRGYINKDDILITLVGNGIGNITLSPSDEVAIIQNTLGLVVKPNVVSSRYLFYYLLTASEEIKNLNRGSGQPSILKPDLLNLKVKVPDLSLQNQVVRVLSAIDNKIELNNRINGNLHKLGQELYKRWFVDFEFPNKLGNPYKSSAGKFIYNDALCREIPEGWERLKIDKVLNFDRGLEPGSKNYEERKTKNNVRFIRVGDMQSSDPVIFVDNKFSKEKKILFDDVSVSFDGTVGRVSIGKEGVYSSGIRKIYAKTGFEKVFSSGFIYFYVHSDLFQQTLKEHASGTIILHASKSIKFLQLPYNEEVFEKFSILADKIYKKILSIEKNNNYLKLLKGTLLSPLVKREIK